MNIPRDWRQLRKFGPKGLVLVMLGLIFILIGISAIAEPWTGTQREQLVMLSQLAPRAFWGWVSIVAGAAAMWSSLWPAWNDSWGFAVLSGLSMWWACAYAAGAILTGAAALSSMFTWLGLCVMLWGISRLVDPPKVWSR